VQLLLNCIFAEIIFWSAQAWKVGVTPAIAFVLRRHRPGLARRHGASFLCQPDGDERLVHGRYRAGHRQLLLDLGQGQVGLGGHQRQQPFPVFRQDPSLPPGVAMAVHQLVGMPPLLQKFLHHADRHPEALGDLLPSTLLSIIGRHDPLPQVQRQRSHPQSMDLPRLCGYSIF